MEKQEIKKKAIEFFNKTWDYIDKTDRTKEEDLTMIDFAFKSKYYWSLIGDEINFVRSDWQISRVFAEANLLEAALYYSKKCLEDTLKLGLNDFDLFFAYEANVRVYNLLGFNEEKLKYHELALKSIDTISKKEDKDYCLSELNNIVGK